MLIRILCIVFSCVSMMSFIVPDLHLLLGVNYAHAGVGLASPSMASVLKENQSSILNVSVIDSTLQVGGMASGCTNLLIGSFALATINSNQLWNCGATLLGGVTMSPFGGNFPNITVTSGLFNEKIKVFVATDFVLLVKPSIVRTLHYIDFILPTSFVDFFNVLLCLFGLVFYLVSTFVFLHHKDIYFVNEVSFLMVMRC